MRCSNASVLISVADAVVALIRAHSPDSSYTRFRVDPSYIPEARRSYSDFILEIDESDIPGEAGKLRIDVVPKGIPVISLVTRGGDKTLDCEVVVILRYVFRTDEHVPETGRLDPTILDDLVALTELFVTFFQQPEHRRLPAYQVATLKDDASIPVLAPGDFLRTHHQFLSAINLTYQAYIDAPAE
jgi:hypothetical protein